jgi:hypothetical protein
MGGNDEIPVDFPVIKESASEVGSIATETSGSQNLERWARDQIVGMSVGINRHGEIISIVYSAVPPLGTTISP